jgi:hypothetical protein
LNRAGLADIVEHRNEPRGSTRTRSVPVAHVVELARSLALADTVEVHNVNGTPNSGAGTSAFMDVTCRVHRAHPSRRG